MTGGRRAGLLWLALIATVASPVILNAVNLYRLSTERLGLTGPAALALPISLDGAALVALIVRLRGLRDGDSTPAASLAVLGFAGLSAWLAATEGHAVGGTVGAVALGALPIVAVVMLDLAVGSIRRTELRALGLLPGRAPVFSTLRWVLAPRSTAAAWRHGVLWENPDRYSCLAAVTRPPSALSVPLPGGHPEEPSARTAIPGTPSDGRPRPLTGPPTPPRRSSDGTVEITSPGRVALPVRSDAPRGDGAREDVSGAAGDGAPPSGTTWEGTKRDLIRSLIAVGILDRTGIITACAAQGMDVSAREVTHLIAQHHALTGATGDLGRAPDDGTGRTRSRDYGARRRRSGRRPAHGGPASPGAAATAWATPGRPTNGATASTAGPTQSTAPGPSERPLSAVPDFDKAAQA